MLYFSKPGTKENDFRKYMKYNIPSPSKNPFYSIMCS